MRCARGICGQVFEQRFAACLLGGARRPRRTRTPC
jgi:hypothetical protein